MTLPSASASASVDADIAPTSRSPTTPDFAFAFRGSSPSCAGRRLFIASMPFFNPAPDWDAALGGGTTPVDAGVLVATALACGAAGLACGAGGA